MPCVPPPGRRIRQVAGTVRIGLAEDIATTALSECLHVATMRCLDSEGGVPAGLGTPRVRDGICAAAPRNEAAAAVVAMLRGGVPAA